MVARGLSQGIYLSCLACGAIACPYGRGQDNAARSGRADQAAGSALIARGATTMRVGSYCYGSTMGANGVVLDPTPIEKMEATVRWGDQGHRIPTRGSRTDIGGPAQTLQLFQTPFISVFGAVIVHLGD